VTRGTLSPTEGRTPDHVGESPARRPVQRQRFPGWIKKLALLLVSVIVTLGVLEIGFRIAGFEPVYSVYSHPEVFWQKDRLLGWSLEPGARGTYVGPRPFPIQFRTDIRINSLGLRGAEIRDIPRSGVRILVLGDSMTAGFEVAEGDTYAALTQRRLRRLLGVPVQVINAGVRGYGTDQAHLLYRHRLRSLHPDAVVYHTTTNDADDNVTLHRARRPFSKPAFALRRGGRLELVGDPVRDYPLCSTYKLNARFRIERLDTLRSRSLCWLQVRLADHSALFSFVSTRIAQNPSLLNAIYGLGSPEGQPTAPGTGATRPLDHGHRLTSELIARLASAVQRDGADFVLLGQRTDLSLLALDGGGVAHMNVVALDEALGPRPGEEVRFPVDGHYNERGHRKVAELLAERLARMLPS
jgi:lysophospholipase L1-like esterase